jgi:hypothetical protein
LGHNGFFRCMTCVRSSVSAELAPRQYFHSVDRGHLRRAAALQTRNSASTVGLTRRACSKRCRRVERVRASPLAAALLHYSFGDIDASPVTSSGRLCSFTTSLSHSSGCAAASRLIHEPGPHAATRSMRACRRWLDEWICSPGTSRGGGVRRSLREAGGGDPLR